MDFFTTTGLPMPEAALQPLTFDELEALEDREGRRYELWNGQAYAMTGGTPAHNLIALGLQAVIKPQLPRGCRVFVADVGLRLGPSAYSDKAYPDVMVVCQPQPETVQTAPSLVAEVLSDSSVGRDRNAKLEAYRMLPSVQAYLILSQTTAAIEVYRRDTAWNKALYHGKEALIQLTEPTLSLPLREIYADVWEELGG
jgi:Uma2 family endonuclease